MVKKRSRSTVGCISIRKEPLERQTKVRTCPFLLAALGVMILTYLATMSITNLACLLLARVVMAAVLYFVVMKVARVAILDECIRFVLKKK